MPRSLGVCARALLGLTSTFVMAVSATADTMYYVDAGLATGANDGSSWESAFQGAGGLALALAAANAGDSIWVADGTYLAGTTRGAVFSLKNGVAIYGGFAGGETELAQRNPIVNVSRLSGDMSGNDAPYPANEGWDENSYHVVSAVGRNATAVLDGFTISNGRADGGAFGSDLRNGAGVFIANGSATFRNVIFMHNRALSTGGCVYIRNGNPVFIDCTFRDSRANGPGGGCFMGANSSPTFSHCLFRANTSTRGGGAALDASTGIFTNCLFNANYADDTGSPSDGGGAMCVSSNSTATLINCTVHSNRAHIWAAGVLCNNSTTNVHNSIIAGNTVGGSGDLQLTGLGYNVSYTCGISRFAGQNGNISANPQLVSPSTGDFRPRPTSPVIDAASNANVPAGIITDFAHLPRFRDNPATPDTGVGTPPIVDMGAHEFQPPEPVCPQIAEPPQGATLCRNADHVLTVVAQVGAGGTITGYQWRKDAVDIPGAITSALALENVTNAAEADYTVVVYAEGCSSLESAAASIIVCQTDANCDHVINSTDVSDFINLWFADQAKGTSIADFDGNGTVNSTDVSDFINVWFDESANGCAG